MRCVILAAGRGVRMGELTDTRPKPMLTLKGKPILDYKISNLPDAIDEIVLIVGYNREIVEHYFGDSYAGKKIIYIVQRELNGSGGALHVAKSLLQNRFLVIMGDDLYAKQDLENLLQFECAFLGARVTEPVRTGFLQISADGKLEAVREHYDAKPGDIMNAGAYMLTKDFFEYPLVRLPNGEYGLPQTIATMADKHHIIVQYATHWLPISKPEDLVKAEKMLDEFYPGT
jgi:UDP-N-acetylglucosamine diphosphorylase / glucose-1-phosphate thymidylyltransferase / UDP-N-acetylgalactosamine diphosphorylase / glucosamine-1-phosphate N-acetyltransferase / galactosamine-1-phosphate N-acetyltransferase